MVVATEMQHAVHDGLGQVLGLLGTDHDVAELARPGRRPVAVDRERQHVGWAVAVAVVAIELVDLGLADEGDRQVQLSVDLGRRQRGAGGRVKARRGLRRVDDLDLDQALLRDCELRSSGACDSAYSP
jgi:hypothetical protein